MANNRTYRLCLAFGMAVLVHSMIMNMEITKGPVVLPDFHIPRSVNVFLGQTSQSPSIKDHIKKVVPVIEKVTAKPVLEEISAEKTLPVKESNAVNKTAVPVPSIKKTPLADQTVETLKTEKPVVENMTESIPSESLITSTGVQQSNVIKSTADMGQQDIGAIRMARPMYRVNPPPVYPKLARKRGYEGTVVLQVLVNKQGRVDDLQIDLSSNHAMLDRAALNSVKKWHFEPGKRGNKKIDMWVKVPVTFKLDE